ncbi:hypothetical protein [Microbacterium sp. Leaf161]|uniref:hypothetical protein n=1 Tax=Microbacterium sp. Leaf161 TaxID=1736281 RepID=UPI000A932F14|nr:hypothetical protein [Microbacterium sp. Leaf161]
MKIKCVENSPSKLDAAQLLVPAEYQSIYPLTIGREYPVVGMLLFSSRLNLLTVDDDELPILAPAAMFASETLAIPEGWHFATRADLGRLDAAWGYPELVASEGHFEHLAELEPAALQVFRRYVDEALAVVAPNEER